MLAFDLPTVCDPAQQQKIFRASLDAMARPGRVVDLGPWLGESSALIGFLACLCDGAVAVADPDAILSSDDWRFLNCKRGPVAEANFIVADGRRPLTDGFNPRLGTLEAPETGATLLLIVTKLDDQLSCIVSGPGIRKTQKMDFGDLDPLWLRQRNKWCTSFPTGVDIVISDPTQIVALPRTTVVNMPGSSA